MKRTSKYQLAYFEQGDYTDAANELQRWQTLDAQLSALYNVLGNGVLDGWNLLPSSGLSIVVSAGSGNISLVSVSSTSSVSLTGLTPNTRSYIYAALTQTSYWDQSVSFNALSSLDTSGRLLYLGYVDTNLDSVTGVNMDNRTNLGFINSIIELISEHRHIGGTENPSPVNLATDVQGIISQNNLPDLDASIVKTGTLDSDRLPLIDHITKLTNQGTLTHAQLDSFVEALSITNPTLMGETSTVNLLQLILAIKHIYPDIDEYLVNEIAYIPGISPDSYVDWDHTTATVDITPYSEGGSHTIVGAATDGKNAYTKTWDSEDEFTAGISQNVYIVGDSVSLATQNSYKLFDEFSSATSWQVVTEDLSASSLAITIDPDSVPPSVSSGKITIGDQQVEMLLTLKKSFDAQDWSEYDYITFYLKTEDVEHGDVYFYLNDAFYGAQNSYIKVLNRNTPTVNVDTLQNGWQEVTVDISSYTRTNINALGFYFSTQEGWDTSKGFDFKIDTISLSGGNKYKESGYLRVIYGSDFLYDFWRVRWDTVIPTDASSAGLVFKARTRVGNSLSDLAQAIWSSYSTVSGYDIPLPTGYLYKYIEIEVYFGASTDYSRSAVLKKLYLDFYTADVTNQFTYNTKDYWDSGANINIDTNSAPGSIMISNTDEINDIIYGTNGEVVQLDDNMSVLYSIPGTTLPRSTYQILNNLSPGLEFVAGVSRGNNGSFWIADTDNDRVVEIDKSGSLIRGFWGSYLVENAEESGTTTTSTTTLTTNLVNILSSLYNSDKGILYTVFDRDLTSSELSLITNKYIKIGTQMFYLDQFVTSFAMNGLNNVLSTTINGADKTLLSYMVYQEAPTIITSTPYEQQRINSSSVTVKWTLYNFELGTEGTGNYIRVTLDESTVYDIREQEKVFTGLSNGLHTVKAQLYNSNGTPNTNIEATVESTFVVYIGSYSAPYISVVSPCPNQVYSSSPVTIDFDVDNFPILSTGQHIRYSVDLGSLVDHYTEEPIIISDLTAGKHSIRLYLVDKKGSDLAYTYGSVGSDLAYTYGSVTVDFIIGLNSKARPVFYCSMDGTMEHIDVYVGNMIFTDMYAPFDVQYIPNNGTLGDTMGKESILIGKLTNDYIKSKL